MKVRTVITVTIHDRDDWSTTYGVEGDAAIREDVKSHIGNGVYGGVPFEYGDGEVPATVTWS